MTVLLFLVVLIALIVVHEFGHFVVAKLSGMRVDEFGLGYPPRALVLWRHGGTEYTLNWLPFGGFVKIYGEDEQDLVVGTSSAARAFGARPKILQALVLLAGIAMNLAFAWVLLSSSLALGTIRPLDPSEVAQAKDAELVVADVLPGSPAALAGLMPGDAVRSATIGTDTFSKVDADAFVAFIAGDTGGAPMTLSIDRNGKPLTLTATPKAGIVPNDATRPALGVVVAAAGTLPVPLLQAPVEGAQLTWELTKEIAVGLWHFFAGIVTGKADLSQVAGPVGIAGAVGVASRQGLTALLSLTALISINLALVNLIPVPALDGGRLLFVIIEAVIRRPLNPSIARAVNTVGFALLILLMLVVTAHDVFKLVG